MVFSVSSCGSPAKKFLDKLQPLVDSMTEFSDVDDMSKKDKEKYAKIVKDLIEFVEDNEDYKLTDSDKEAAVDMVVDASKKMAKKEGEKLDSDDIDEIRKNANKRFKKVETLGELAEVIEFDPKSLKGILKELED